MSDTISDCLMCDRKAECFQHLTSKELELFDSNKTTISYRKGETILKQGTEFTHVVSFNAGLAKLNIEAGQLKNVMIGIIKPTEILGGPGMFSNNKYSFSVTALTEATICLINVDVFKKLIRTNEKFAESFLSSFSSRYTQAINRLVSLSHKQMNGRVAEALIYLADEIYVSNSYDLPISRQELADFTGMSKESISRIFKDFQTDTIIDVSGKTIQIINKEKLIDINRKG